MKKWVILFIVSLVLSLTFIIQSNNSPKVIISKLAKKGNIRTGELRYRIYLFGIVPVGEAVFESEKVENYRDKKVYRLKAAAQSLELFSKFFRGSAILDSFVDVEELNPIAFKEKLIVSGKPDTVKEITYDQKNGIMSIGDVKRQIFPNTQDPLSAMFNIRRMDFSKVKEFEMNINTNQKNYILKGEAQEKAILINKQTYEIVLVKVEIRRHDNNPYHNSKMDIVLLEEKENIPIFIKVFAGGMLINAKLIEAK